MALDLRGALPSLNSMTKYPSIPPYHPYGADGILLEEPVSFGDPETRVVITEKVDGVNTRVIVLPGGVWVLGSRDELLTAKGDLIANPAQGIVGAVSDHMPALAAIRPEPEQVVVLYLEVFGGVTSAAREYTGTRRSGFRLFDVAVIDHDEMVGWPVDRIAAWRDRGGQRFLAEADLAVFARDNGLQLTPRLAVLPAKVLPQQVAGMDEFLRVSLPHTQVPLDEFGRGRAEGVVLRTGDRGIIAKARQLPYARTMARRRQEVGA